ncbi:MAG: sugar phosphate isomerase/epimerase [Phycisphaerales bacterium]|nr:MAG: sugar phosphate isomerase/epimerase [Phycisphaerales bacterium]
MAHAVPQFNASAPLAALLTAVNASPPMALKQIAAAGFRDVQLDARQHGLRPRELDRSARRGLAADLRRLELRAAGIDMWIPPEHFLDSARVDHAVHALLATIDLAGELGRMPVSLALPRPETTDDSWQDVLKTIRDACDRSGAMLADHALPLRDTEADEAIGVGIDPASLLASSEDPCAAVHAHAERVTSARLSDLYGTGMRGPIGHQDGRLDWRGYQIALSVAGYNRPVVVDSRQWSEPWVGSRQTLALWTGGHS